ncbi:MAG: hypothetical protein K1X92_08490, partial [Bacteroidia bacterium]|nr:hypothetical protein [Bacteroidia bacterium]
MFQYFRNSIIIVILLLGSGKSYASHFSGFEMWYECLNACEYRIFQTTYYDCGGQATAQYLPPGLNAQNIPLSSFLTPTGSCILNNPLNWNFLYYEDITTVCPAIGTDCYDSASAVPGLVAVTYYADYDICNTGCSSVTLSWSSCCRTYAYSSGAGGQSLFSEMTLDFTASQCNNSPYFKSPPLTYLCAGQTTVTKLNVFDIDGDSLVYTLGDCLQGQQNSVTYNTGFSASSPLGPSWTVNLDSQTGELTFIPNPGGIVSAPVCIYVTEYRNGIQIGQISRDFPLSVINCTGASGQANDIPSDTLVNLLGGTFINPNKISVDAGTLLSFEVYVTDTDTLQSLGFHHNPLMNGGVLTSDTLGDSLHIYFEWQPSIADSGSHYLWLDFFDDNCWVNAHKYRLIEIITALPSISASITEPPCGSNSGAINITVNTGQPPFSYLWNTGDTTQDLTGLFSGVYIVTVTDDTGFVFSETFYVNNSNGISANPGVGNISCNFPTGIIAANASGGNPPYNYDWNTGDTVAVLLNVPAGNYFVNISDTSGCFLHTVIQAPLPPGCYNLIGGKIFFDVNQNCVQDSGEIPLPYAYVDVNPGGAALTDSAGSFTFMVDTGNFVLTYFPYSTQYMNILCPNINPVTVVLSQLGIDSLDFDIPVSIDSVADLEVNLYEDVYIPGFLHSTQLSFTNHAPLPVYSTLTYMHSPWIYNPVFSIAPDTYNPLTHTAVWTFNPANVLTIQSINIQSFVSYLAPPDSPSVSFCSYYCVVNDLNPINNQDTVQDIILSSYDPNYKEVTPFGVTANGYIPYNTPTLKYTVHFQNTGTWYAEYVIIKDKLDNNLDFNTLQYLGSSHNCTFAIDDNDTLIITFANIHLPDSGTDLAGSQGFVSFSMKPKPGLVPETMISNTAGIYFDFNDPIITNTVNSTFHYSANVLLSNPICEGEPVTATVQNGVPPYLWNGNVPDSTGVYTFIPATSGPQTLTMEDAFSPVSTGYNVSSPPQSAGFSWLPSGNATLFFVQNTGYSNYLWDFGNGSTSTQM